MAQAHTLFRALVAAAHDDRRAARGHLRLQLVGERRGPRGRARERLDRGGEEREKQKESHRRFVGRRAASETSRRGRLQMVKATTHPRDLGRERADAGDAWS